MKRTMIIICSLIAVCGVAYAIDTGTRGISMSNGSKPGTSVGEIWVAGSSMHFADGANADLTLTELAAGGSGGGYTTATATGPHGAIQYNQNGVMAGLISSQIDHNTGSVLFGNNLTTDTYNYTFRAGNKNRTSGDYASVFGGFCQAGNYGFAGGTTSTANALGAVTFGNANHSSGTYSASFGNEAWSTGANSFSAGWFPHATGANSFAVGYKTSASGSNSAAIGDRTTATKTGAVSIGSLNTATGTSAVVAGYDSDGSGGYSVTIGRSNDNRSEDSVAIGSWNVIKSGAGGNLALGYSAKVSGNTSAQLSLDSGQTTETGTNCFSVVGGKMAVGKVAPTSQFEVNQNSRYNVSGGDYDTIISSDHITNMVQVDASLDKLNVGGDMAITSATTIGETLGVTGVITGYGGLKTADISASATALRVGSNATSVSIGYGGQTNVNSSLIVDDDTTVTGNIVATGNITANQFIGPFLTTSTISAGGNFDTTGTITSRSSGSSGIAGKLVVGKTSSTLSNVFTVWGTDGDNIVNLKSSDSQVLPRYRSSALTNGCWAGLSGYGSGSFGVFNSAKSAANLRLTEAGNLKIPRGGIETAVFGTALSCAPPREYAFYKFEDTISSVSKSLTDSAFRWNGAVTSKTFTGITTSGEERTTTGLLGNALAFDGVDDYINLGPSFGEEWMQANHDFTISLWWRNDNTSFTATGNRILYKRVTTPANNGFDVYQILTSGQDRFIWVTYIGGVTWTNIVYNKTDYAWHNYTLTRSGTTLVLYIDGTSFATSTNAAYSGSIANGNNWYIGSQTGSANFAKGSMDNFRCLPYALSATAVSKQIWNGGAGSNNTISQVLQYDSPSFVNVSLTGNQLTSGTAEVDGASEFNGTVTATGAMNVAGTFTPSGLLTATGTKQTFTSATATLLNVNTTSKFKGTTTLAGSVIANGTKQSLTSATATLLNVDTTSKFKGATTHVNSVAITPGNGVVPLTVTGSALAGQVAVFSNPGNSSAATGIKIQCGMNTPDTTDCYFIDVYDSDGTVVGGAYYDNTNLTWLKASDANIKTAITTATLTGSEAVRKLRVAEFEKRDDPKHLKVNGFIAQEMQAVAPEAVSIHTNPSTGQQTMMISQEALIPYLWQYARDAQKETDALTKRVTTLEETIRSLEERLQAVEKTIEKEPTP